MEDKNLYIICGCNGAGKTTALPTKKYQESMDRIVRGLVLAEREMLEAKAKNDENVIVCQEDGVIRSIPASKFL